MNFSFGSRIQIYEPDDLNDFVDAIDMIVKKVFLKKYMTLNVITAVESQNDVAVQELKTLLMTNKRENCAIRFNNHTAILRNLKRLRNINLIFLDNFRSFEVFFKSITSDKFNFRGFYLIVLAHGKFDGIEEIFRLFWAKGITNVNLIFIDKGEVQVSTFKPFENVSTCGKTSEVFVDKFINGSFLRGFDKVFPAKLKNLFGCKVRVTTFDRCPAVCASEELFGFDIELLNGLSKALNFNVDLNFLEGAAKWGTILSDGSTTGAIAEIVNGKADFIIGGLLLRSSRVEIMDYSDTYFSNPVVFIVPPGEKLNRFQKLLRPFDSIVWIVLLSILMTSLVVMTILSLKLKNLKQFIFGSKVENPSVNLLIAIFGGSQTHLPTESVPRLFLIMIVVFCLVVRSAYQGLMFKFLQSDGRLKEVQSIDEMIEKNYRFYMYESHVDLIQNNQQINAR